MEIRPYASDRILPLDTRETSWQTERVDIGMISLGKIAWSRP